MRPIKILNINMTENAKLKVSKETMLNGIIKAFEDCPKDCSNGILADELAFELAKQKEFKKLTMNEAISYIVTYTDYKPLEWNGYEMSFPKYGFNHKIFVKKIEEE